MISVLIKLLPMSFKNAVRPAYKNARYELRRLAIKLPVMLNRKIKIIVGAAETFQNGWYSTNEQWLDITKPEHWNSVFRNKQLLTHIVAEHVFEHLTYEEAQTALACSYRCLAKGGRIRIAVPDGYNPDSEYLRHVCIAGIGDDAADHKQLLNADILIKLLTDAGFKTFLLEGYDKSGKLIQNPYSAEDGFIWRSRVSTKAKPESWNFTDAQTSLIVDGIKDE